MDREAADSATVHVEDSSFTCEAPKETDTTDTTDKVTNQQFLETVFGVPGLSRPMVVSFAGNPTNAKAWGGVPWAGSNTLIPEANNYFSLAVFAPDEAGEYRRRKDRFAALHAIMLDDIGTKIAAEQIQLQPSWALETSPGNYQYGYLLAEPLADGARADAVMQGIIHAGLCDPGAGGPLARLARLPIGTNGKHEAPFRCRMTVWSPDKRYTIEELEIGLNVLVAKNSAGHMPELEEGEQVSIPRPTENTVLEALRARGLYKKPLGAGKHDITCPWVTNHSDGNDDGSAYFEPSGATPMGGFKCHHGHCAQRRLSDLLAALGVSAAHARMKPAIHVIPGEFHRVIPAAEEHLAAMGHHYQRGGLIVAVVTDPSTGITAIQECNAAALTQALSAASDWKQQRREVGWVRIDPPARHVAALYEAPSYRYLPVLAGLTHQPYLRASGSLAMTSGHDPESGMFGVFNEHEYNVPAAPTRAEAEAALTILDELLDEFCFATPLDRVNAQAAMLTAAVRPSLETAPMIHVKANQPGSGKSYLCQLIALLATPQHSTPLSFPRDEEECRKVLLAQLLRGPAVVEFDNLTTDLLAHKSLCTALTSPYITDRILGVSKTATVGTRSLFLSSGNNVGPVKDMTRRCLTITLDPACENPAMRTFKRPNLVEEVRQQRGRYVSAALTIIAAWIQAGRPMAGCASFAGFGTWSNLVRQPLLWLGCADPIESVAAAMSSDPERETLGQLLDLWYANFGSRPTMVRHAVTSVEGAMAGGAQEELKELLQDIAGEKHAINRRILDSRPLAQAPLGTDR